MGQGTEGREIASQSQLEAEEEARVSRGVRPMAEGGVGRGGGGSQWAGAGAGRSGGGRGRARGRVAPVAAAVPGRGWRQGRGRGCVKLPRPSRPAPGGTRSARERVSARGGEGPRAARVGAAAVTIHAGKPAALPRARRWLEQGEGRGGVRQRGALRCFVLRELMKRFLRHLEGCPETLGLCPDEIIRRSRRRAPGVMQRITYMNRRQI
ncbi:spidroin-1-like [Corvus cornix cornix]|uniref:spidroin-1-like n=1 Tax=Corvus cornix cornix TaxID=932674 RepID=UPI00194F26E8|nr:spidroin-1-like [Corvus cornix cornix]